MAFQSVPDCAEAVIEFSLGSKQLVNVLGFHRPGGYIQTDLDTLAALVDTRVGSDYLPETDASVNYVGTAVHGLAVVNDLQSSNSTNAGAGGSSGATLPANVSLCITLRTALSGRSARGRFYAVPTNGTKLASVNTFSAAYGNALVAFLTGVQTDAALNGWSLVIISRFAAKAKRVFGVTFPVTLAAYRNLTCDSQRGRLPRGH